ncbi:hypothetical protein MHU86_2041 [Fragilaria crotonensis]|nr:hypothetical protein MHU86_2041 [Fragilaria crotonensis]
MALASSSVSMPVAGAGGLVMGHQAQAMARPAMPPPGTSIPSSAGMGGPPVSIAALGADLVDKSHLSLKQVKNVSHLSIVAVDLYASDPMVASFPPKPAEPDLSLTPTLVGKFQPHLSFQRSEIAHKMLRKYLTKDITYEELRASALATSTTEDSVTIEKPHQWLGMRRLQDTPQFIKDSNPVLKVVSEDVGGTSAVISEEASLDSVHLTNGTLDGLTGPNGDDFDRVVFKVRLASSKKAVTILPEEATTLILTVAQSSVARKDAIDEDPSIYPLAIAVPGWMCHDACLEAWMDSVPGAVFFQRSIGALCGAMQPGATDNAPNLLLQRIGAVSKALKEAHQKKNDGTEFEYEPLVIMVGLSNDGVECTAVQVSDVQNSIPACIFGNYKVLCNYSYPTLDPASKLESCLAALSAQVDEVASDIEGPVAIVPYATNKEQMAILRKALESATKTASSWATVPILPAKLDCVVIGTAVLGAVTHGRLATLIEGGNGKPKAALAIRVHNVAPTAVGVRMSYRKDEWTPVKTIFDFDRRVPAGPYEIDLSAAQCAAMLEAGAGQAHEWFSDALSDAVELALKKVEGSKGIPRREAAALAFKVQIVQKITRDGEWKNVGDAILPLTKVDDKSNQEKRVACEKIRLEVSVNSTGVITQSLVGELETVVQAVVSSRNSSIRYWAGLILAIAFFGGFLIKSYWEEHIFERDTKRLLTYYKHAAPNSLADGDLHNARYLVWKYRGKKKALWKRLEKKYGVPVLNEWEWEVANEAKDDESEEEILDVDSQTKKEETSEQRDL